MYRKLVFHLHLSEALAVLAYLNDRPISYDDETKVQKFMSRLRGDIAEQVLNNSDVLKWKYKK